MVQKEYMEEFANILLKTFQQERTSRSKLFLFCQPGKLCSLPVVYLTSTSKAFKKSQNAKKLQTHIFLFY